ncbi:MAG TPA: flavin reductase family protein [Solirubrobacteraceae bacterium]|nr:flavin reductase family protein [Solirubrobacteraceae bacterium]
MADRATVATGHRLDPRTLRSVLGTFVTGVTVITTVGADGAPQGLTANSFTSVSLEPPLVLFCVSAGARCAEAFATSDGFVVHILGHDQEELAVRFASPTADRWAGLARRPSSTGAPLLCDCETWLDCVTTSRLTIGDHIVVVGRVAACGSASIRPLAFCRGSFLPLDPEIRLRGAGGAQRVLVRWLLNFDGRLALARLPDGALTVPSLPAGGVSLHDERLLGGLREHFRVRADLPSLYSIFDDERGSTLTIVYRADASAAAGGPPDDWTLVEHRDAPWERISDPALSSMVRRYIDEYATARFGIYAGSLREGRVEAVAGGR